MKKILFIITALFFLCGKTFKNKIIKLLFKESFINEK